MATSAITTSAARHHNPHVRPSSASADLAWPPFGNMLTYLEAEDALNCDKVCRVWHTDVSRNPLVWKVYCERIYPDTALELLSSNSGNQVNWQREYLLQRVTERNIARGTYQMGFRSVFPDNASNFKCVEDSFVCYEVAGIKDKETPENLCTDIMFRQLPEGKTIRLASISSNVLKTEYQSSQFDTEMRAITLMQSCQLVTQINALTSNGEILFIQFNTKIESIPPITFNDGATTREISFKVAGTQDGHQDWSTDTICSWDSKTNNFKVFALVPEQISCLCGTKNALYIGGVKGDLIKFDLSGKRLASNRFGEIIKKIIVEQGRICVACGSHLLIFSEDNISAPLHSLYNKGAIADFQVKGNKAFVGGRDPSNNWADKSNDLSIQIWDIQDGKHITAIAQHSYETNYRLTLHNGLLFNLTNRNSLHVRDVKNLAAIRHITSIQLNHMRLIDFQERNLFFKKGKICLRTSKHSFTFLNFRPSLHTDATLVKRLSGVETRLVQAPASAIAAFDALPENERNRIYGRVWALKGSPMGNPEFGRFSFRQMPDLSRDHHCSQDDRVAVVRQQRKFVQSTPIATLPANNDQIRVIRQEEVERVLSDTLVEQLIDIIKAHMPQNTEAEIADLSEAERNRLYEIVYKLKSPPDYLRSDFRYPFFHNFGRASFHRSGELSPNFRCTQAERKEAVRRLKATQTAAAGTGPVTAAQA